MKCDVDIRKDVCADVVSSGGTAMFQVTGGRRTQELTALGPFTKITAVGSSRVNSVWTGGSVLSSVSTFQRNSFFLVGEVVASEIAVSTLCIPTSRSSRTMHDHLNARATKKIGHCGSLRKAVEAELVCGHAAHCNPIRWHRRVCPRVTRMSGSAVTMFDGRRLRTEVRASVVFPDPRWKTEKQCMSMYHGHQGPWSFTSKFIRDVLTRNLCIALNMK